MHIELYSSHSQYNYDELNKVATLSLGFKIPDYLLAL